MSGGIGKDWHKKYKGDTYKDHVVHGHAKHKIPRYYDKLLEQENPELLEQIKEKRILAARSNVKTENKLHQEDEISKIKLKLKERQL